MRSDSLRIASMYLRLPTVLILIWLASVKVDRTSCFSFSKTSGWVSNRYVAPESVVAVVSEPARTKMNAFDDNFSNDRFYGRPMS